MVNRFSLILFSFLCLTLSVFGQGSESFTNLTSSGSTYETGSFIGDYGLQWSYQNARNILPTSAYSINGRSIGLNEGSSINSSINVYSGTNGVGRVSYKIRSFFTLGDASERKVEIYINGVLFDSYTLAAMNTVFERSFTANVPGNVLIEFRSKGSRQIALDDIAWTEHNTVSVISVDKNTISELNYGEGFGPSLSKSFNVMGNNLLGDVIITAPLNFEISLAENSGYEGNLRLIPTAGSLPNTTVYIRLKSGLSAGNFGGNLTLDSAAAASKTIAVSGNVYIPPANVVLTEIMYDTPGSDDEWIEICNISRSTQNLSNHRIVVGSVTLFTFPSNSYLEDGECITVALGDNGTPPFNEECSFIPNYGSPNNTNNLTNTTRTIEIIANYNSTIVDSVTYSTGNGGDGNGASLHVINAYQGNSTTSFNWIEVPNGGSPGVNSLVSPCSYPEIQLKNSSGNLQACGNFTINFDSQAIGYSTDRTFNIKNEGTIALTIASMDISGDFSVVAPSTPFSLAPGYTQTVTLRYSPTVIGESTINLSIRSNDADESECMIVLKGIGYTPIPEIDVERNTMASITNGSPANTGNNTVFASTVIATTTAPKTYYVRNEGTADLVISSIVSSNPSEFRILSYSGPTVLRPNEYTFFEIDFTPNGIGNRTALISLDNNDVDENPYTFNVKGTGICASANLTLSPTSGPIGTVVTVTGSNYGPNTTASINGLNSSISRISSTTIEVTVPYGASTGNLVVNDNNGCISSKRFTVIDIKATTCEGNNGLKPNDLFISEVTDKGTGSHSYIEIYNGTGATVSLTPYRIAIHNNGSPTPTSTISLSGTIANKGVVVIALGGANRFDREGGYTAQFFSSAVGINDDDHIRLTKAGVWIDLWGSITGDPFTISSKDYTYRRIGNGVYAPSTTWNQSDWIALSPVDYSDIGAHDFSVGIPPIVKSNPLGPSTDCEIVDTIKVEGEEGFLGGQPLNYKWFYNAPGDSGWTEILSSNENFTGQTTSELNLVDLSTMADFQFFSQIEENTVNCYGATTAIRMKVNKTRWNGLFWSDGAPHFGSTAIIAGNYNTGVNGNLIACKLSIIEGAVLTIDNLNYVEVINNVTVTGEDENKPSIIIVKTAGNFIQINDFASVNIVGAGKIEVQKETSPMDKWYQYTYWSSPVQGETVNQALSQSNPSRRFYFESQNYLDSYAEVNNNNQSIAGQDGIDDNGDDWQYAGGLVMKPGVGYASTNSQNSFTNANVTQTFLYKFQGPFNNGLINVPIYRNDNELRDVNWNLLGNPYPSPISADLFLDFNPSLDGAIYLWSQGTEPSFDLNGNEPINFSQDDYAIINGAGETAGGDGIKPNRYIPSGQGFFVSYSNEGTVLEYSGVIKKGNVMFLNLMRTKGIQDNNQFFRRRNPVDANKLWLNLSAENGIFSQMLVAYLPDATDKNDGSYYDAARNLAVNTVANLYSRIENDAAKFVIQGKSESSLNQEEVINLGYSLGIDANLIYQISLAEFQGEYLEENEIILEDKYKNISHYLKDSPYNFTSQMGDFPDRFKVTFSAASFKNHNLEDLILELKIVELTNGEINFTHRLKIENIVITDLTGRKIYNLKASSNSETYTLPQLRQNIYIAQVTLVGGTIITKKILKKI